MGGLEWSSNYFPSMMRTKVGDLLNPDTRIGLVFFSPSATTFSAQGVCRTARHTESEHTSWTGITLKARNARAL